MLKEMSPRFIITFSIIAVILILIANFSFWLETQIFNQQNFAQATVKVMQRKEVQSAVAAEIVDKVFKNQPVISQVAGGLFKSAIGGLLGSSIFEPVIREAALLMNNILTSPNPKPVVIDIAQIKDFLEPILSGGNLGKKIKEVDLPDKIVLFEKNDIPSIYTLGIVFLWIGPIVGIIGIGIIVALIWLTKNDERMYVLKIIGYTLAIGALMVIVLSWLFQAPILASVNGNNMRTVAFSIYSVFVGRFMFQNIYLIIIGIVFVALTYYIPYYKERQNKKRLKIG